MQITKTLGRYDFCSTKEEWCVRICGLPAEAPSKVLAETWPADREPMIEGLLPSEVAELISERMESHLLDTSRESRREVVNWVRKHAEEVDAEYAAFEIARKEKQIERRQAEIAELQKLTRE